MEIQDKIRQYLGEDATDQEKHDKLNDIFQSLERLNDEVYELEFLDAKEGASGVGDLNDQLTTFRKLIGGLYQVLDRATKVVPMEAREGKFSEEELDELNAKGLFKTGFGATGGGGSTPMNTTTGGGSRALQTTGGNTTPKAVRQQHINKRIAKARARVNNSIETEADEIIQSIPSKTVELAGDSIWDRDGSNPKSVQVSSVTIENPYEPGGYMDDDEDDGYRKVSVEHDGPWTIYTDSGFEAAISKMVGFKVVFTEQGMQEDGMASMEGGSEGFEEAKNTPVSDDINRLRKLAGV